MNFSFLVFQFFSISAEKERWPAHFSLVFVPIMVLVPVPPCLVPLPYPFLFMHCRAAEFLCSTRLLYATRLWWSGTDWPLISFNVSFCREHGLQLHKLHYLLLVGWLHKWLLLKHIYFANTATQFSLPPHSITLLAFLYAFLLFASFIYLQTINITIKLGQQQSPGNSAGNVAR